MKIHAKYFKRVRSEVRLYKYKSFTYAILLTQLLISSVCFSNISWTNKVGVTTTSTSITKTGAAGWNAGATSVETLTGNGYLEFTKGLNKAVMIGLSKGNSSSSYTDIDYAIYLNGSNTYSVYESGAQKADFGSFTATDIFRVQVIGSTIKYLKNGSVFYTSTKPISFPLNIDTSLHYTNSVISNISILTASQYPSGSIDVSSPGCSILPNSSTCNTSITWNVTNAPNAGLFIGNNKNYWTDVVGTKTYFNTTTIPVTFYIRINKNNSNSQVLAQEDIYAENYIEPYSLYKGGSNFNWYSHGNGIGVGSDPIQPLFPFGIIKNYHTNNVRSTVQEMLSEMYQDGQRRLRIFIQHSRYVSASSNSYGTVLDSSEKFNKETNTYYNLDEVYLNNILNYVTDIQSAGFEEIIVSMGPTGCNSIKVWRKFYYACEDDIVATFDGDVIKEYNGTGLLPIWLENWNVLKEVKSKLDQSSLVYKIDLSNESIPPANVFNWATCSGNATCDTTMPMNEIYLYQNRWENLDRKLWEEYVLNFGNVNTVGFSWSIANVADIFTKASLLDNIYGFNYPNYMDFHIYDKGNDYSPCYDWSASAYCKYKEVANIFSSLDGIIIGEVYYNDLETAIEFQDAIDDSGVTPDYILQWPLARSPVFYNHPLPLIFDNYIENGF